MHRPLVLLLACLLPLGLTVPSATAATGGVGRGELTVVRGPLVTVGRAVTLDYTNRRLKRRVVAELQEAVSGRWVTRRRHLERDGRHHYVLRPDRGTHHYRVRLRLAGRTVARTAPVVVRSVAPPRIALTTSWAVPQVISRPPFIQIGWSEIRARLLDAPPSSTVTLERRTPEGWLTEDRQPVDDRGFARLQGVMAENPRSYRVVYGGSAQVAPAVSATVHPTVDAGTLVVDGPAMLAPAGPAGVRARFRLDGVAGQHLTVEGEDGQNGGWVLYRPDGERLVLRAGDAFRQGLPVTGSYTLERYAARSTAESLRVRSHPVVSAVVDGPAVLVPGTSADGLTPAIAFDGVPGRFVTVRADNPTCRTAPGRLDRFAVRAFGDGRTANYLHDTRRPGAYRMTTWCTGAASVRIRSVPPLAPLLPDGSTGSWSVDAPGQLAVVPLAPVTVETRVAVAMEAGQPGSVEVIDLSFEGNGYHLGFHDTGRLEAGHEYIAVVRLEGDAVGGGSVTVTPEV